MGTILWLTITVAGVVKAMTSGNPKTNLYHTADKEAVMNIIVICALVEYVLMNILTRIVDVIFK